MKQYICARCKKTCISDWSNEEAIGESVNNAFNVKGCMVVCDACYQEFMAEPQKAFDDRVDIEQAIRIASLWKADKMIGGDQDQVRNALLDEVLQLRAAIHSAVSEEREELALFCKLLTVQKDVPIELTWRQLAIGIADAILARNNYD